MGKTGAASWSRQVVRALLGAIIGAALSGAIYGVLYLGDSVLAGSRLHLDQAWIAVTAWLVVLGALVAWKGRVALQRVEEQLLPPELSDQARSVFRLLGILALCFLFQHHVLRLLLGEPLDLASFLTASRAMAAGVDFYDPSVLAGFADPGLADHLFYPYLYLPFFAVVLRPLAALPQMTAQTAVLLINVSLWPLLVYLALRLVETPPALRGAVAALVLLILPLFYPAAFCMHQGATGILVGVLMLGTFALDREGHSRSAGVLLALAVLIKVVPVFLAGYLLLRKRWRTLIAALVAGVALMALSVAVAGIDPHVYWVTELAPDLASGALTGTSFQPACHFENQSVTGICCQILGEQSSWLRPVSSVVGGLLVLAAGLVLWRRRQPVMDRREASLVLITILLVSTITWFHHLPPMVLPLIALVVEAARQSGWRRWVLAAVTLLLTFGVCGEFYLEPWHFIRPMHFARTIRFQALALGYLTFLVLLILEARGSVSKQA